MVKMNKKAQVVKMNKKAQVSMLQSTILGIVSVVAILGVGYAIVEGLREPYRTNTNNATHPIYDFGVAGNAINGGFSLLDTVKDNLGIVITVAVFTVVLAGISAFAIFNRR